MIIPYRVKNPPRSFPVATVVLIGLNIIVFAATSQYFLVIKSDMVDAYALRWGVTPPITILTAMFLHGDIFHLLGNMLFLWVFGPAVEDRLRPWGYIGLYLLTGFAGDVAHVTMGAIGGQSVPTLGASGCIMGVLGAYWYIFPWSKVCLAYFFMFLIKIGYGVLEVAAVWVIGAYFALDLFNGFFNKAVGMGGGVANFAHVGGAFTGALIVWMLKVKRDSENVSKAQASRAEVKDIDQLTVSELKNILTATPEDEDVLVKYVNKAMDFGTAEDIKYALSINRKAVVTQCPKAVVHYLLVMHESFELLSPTELLYIGRWCHQCNIPEQALRIFSMIQTLHPDCNELELALMTSAMIYWNTLRDAQRALESLDTLLTKFPNGTTMFEAEDLRDGIMRQTRSRAA